MYMQENSIKWQTEEYTYTKKGRDWFWVVGIITIAVAITAVVLGNGLFAVLVLLAGFTLSLQAVKKPRVIEFEITNKGVRTDKIVYPFSSLESFWVEDKIILKSKKFLMPYIIIPLGEIEPKIIRDTLYDFMEEEEQREPLAHQIMERFGF